MTTHLVNDARLLQQVLFDLGTYYWSTCIKMNVNVFAKSARIVIPNCLGISKS